ncbi:phage protein GemA/Gp16 family protein [Aliikangiella maris]|uniref:Phage protein GemA/Gp16 family protein n=2 Tax=Aliikangiella maris TaxID=3162458 RepID=A0ABV3MKN4_9GAMM
MYLSKHYYIKMIDVGKASLNLDSFAYTRLLHSLTGKIYCEEMNISELMQVLNKMQWLGFEPKKKSIKSELNQVSIYQLDRLRQLWFLMSLEGYISDGSDKGLYQWSTQRIKAYDQNIQICRLEWFPEWMLNGLLEELENWHKGYQDII